MLDSSRTRVNEVFTLQSWLPGVNLERACPKLSADEQRDIALQIGEYLGQLHTIRFNRFGEVVSENTAVEESSWEEFFLGFVSKNIGLCEQRGTIDAYLVDSLTDHIARWQWLLPKDQPAVLVHKDFHPGNSKIQKDQKGNWRIIGVYDFEHAIAGHNEFDFAKPYWAFFEPFPLMKEAMLLGYSRVNRLSPLFELRMSKLYRLAEITDFLVFGASRGLNSETARNISTLREILKESV